jgi:hypothetical protein
MHRITTMLEIRAYYNIGNPVLYSVPPKPTGVLMNSYWWCRTLELFQEL